MMRRLFCLLLLGLLLLPASSLRAASRPVIADYRPVWLPVTPVQGGKTLVAIRSFRRNSVPSYLLVDPGTLATRVAPAAGFVAGGSHARQLLSETPYIRTLDRSTAPPWPIQNQGVTHAPEPVDGWILSVDLCPSHRPFEQAFFQTLMARAGAPGRPVPVAISITGTWLKTHPAELAWLKEQSAARRLAITWVNHSEHHPYTPGVPLEKNFVLTPGTDFRSEVLTLEERLLAEDLLPSPFFRFPGLVSNETVVRQLKEMGLIPLGSDAWLAKGERPKSGSIILIHGNGNEPPGIRKMLELLRSPTLPPFLSLPTVVSGRPG